MRSLIVSASSWSCVTKMNVTPDVLLEGLELDLEVLAEPRVERPERLVEEEHARPQDERARECNALLLAARELVRLAPLEPGELDELECLGHGALLLVA